MSDRLQTPPRVLFPVGVLASLYFWGVFITTFQHPGLIGIDYLGVGTDYMVFDTAAVLARRGDLATLYDGDRFTALLNETFQNSLHEPFPFRPWIYPPPFLLVMLPFSLLGFYASYGLFQILATAAFAASLRIRLARRWAVWSIWFAAVLCPAASVIAVAGQNSFLIAAMLVAGSGLVEGSPLLAGVMFGLLTVKPQFFLLVPVVLVAAQAWRALAAAFFTSLAMAISAAVLFGPRVWTDWFVVMQDSTSGADPRWFWNGRAWGESVYACAFWFGAGPGLASVVQWTASLLAGCCVWLAFRAPMAFAPRTAVLLAASLLAAPHSGAYDLVLLVAASALYLSDLGQRANKLDWWLGFMAWMEPLFGIPGQTMIARFGPVLTLALLGRILWRTGGWGQRNCNGRFFLPASPDAKRLNKSSR